MFIEFDVRSINLLKRLSLYCCQYHTDNWNYNPGMRADPEESISGHPRTFRIVMVLRRGQSETLG